METKDLNEEQQNIADAYKQGYKNGYADSLKAFIGVNKLCIENITKLNDDIQNL